jgi:hypothetical protein
VEPSSPRFAADVTVALELLDRIPLEKWPLLMEGPMSAPPRVRINDAELLEDVLGWLASRAADEPSYVQAAVANVARCLEDWLLVLHYDMEVRGQFFFVSSWYRTAGPGATGRAREVEHYEIHQTLIHNLTVELTRAVNLVIVRARKADARALLGVGLAVVDTGSAIGAMRAAQYSEQEREMPQPYPGLRSFPAVIAQRDLGALGERSDGVPRYPSDLEHWIEALLQRLGRQPADPAPPGRPPFALARPDDTSWTADRPRSLILTGYAIVVAVGVIGQVVADRRLRFAALAALVVGVLLHRALQHRHSTWPIVAVALAAVGGWLGAGAVFPRRGERSVQSATIPSATATGSAPASSSASSAPAPTPPAVPTGSSARHVFAQYYTGPVWIELSRTRDMPSGERTATLKWGAKERVAQVSLQSRPVFLITDKTGHDATPLRVDVEPEVVISFGTGVAATKAGLAMQIDNGWTG